MASTGVQNGRFAQVFINGVAIAHATSHSFSPTRDMRDTTSKDSEGWRNVAPGLRSWTMSGEFLFAHDALTGYSSLWSKWKDGTRVQVKFSTNESGDKYYSGWAYIGELPQESPNEDNVTFSMTLEGDGPVEEKTLT